MQPFFTIGHSTRTIAQLASLLAPNGVTRLVDVRTVPRSRFNPQFNTDVMAASLAAHGIAYEHIAGLGGLRGRKPGLAPEVNGFWENGGFHNYADYAMTSDAFGEGLRRLVEIAAHERCAYMCAEAVWWRCHRRIITDYLLAEGHEVFHILESDVPEPARMTPEARPAANGRLAYPSRQAGLGL